jgi:glycosyltransferase involved in cell wall biosynthesis
MKHRRPLESLELIPDTANQEAEGRAESYCLFVAGDSPESYSPAGERLRNMALANASVFGRTIVLTMGKHEKRSQRRVDSTALLYKTGFSRATPFPLSSLFDPIRLIVFIIRGLLLCSRYSASYIVVSMPPFETGMGGWILTKLLRKKLIIDYMDDWEASLQASLTRYIPRKLMVPIFKLSSIIYSSSALLFVVTPTLANRIRQRGIIVSTILVPNGADTLIFFPRNKSRSEIRIRCSLPLSKTVIVYCGSGLNPYYRLDLILLAAKSLPVTVKEKVFFVFYLSSGAGHYRRLKESLRISDGLVEIREPLPRRALSEAMAACDVGLVPFDDEPYLSYAMSTKVYEYLSSGLYVIGSGPRGGELDTFFSQNANCGTFVRPALEDFVSVFLKVAKSKQALYEDDARDFRYSFVRDHYDARKIMVNAMSQISSLEAGRND